MADRDALDRPGSAFGAGIEAGQRALLEREHGFRLIANAIPQIVWTATPDGDLDFYNRRWVEFSGCTPEETRKRGRAAFLHPDELQRTIDIWTEASHAGREHTIEHRLRRHDGVYRWFLTRAAPLRDETGKIVKWFGTATDIHDRKVAEQRLAESEVRYRTLFEHAGVGVAHADLDGRWLMVNEKFAEILGYAREELVGRKFHDHTHPEDLAEDLMLAAPFNAGQIPVIDRDKRYLRKDGSAVWVHVTVSLVRDPSGVPQHRVAVVRDITGRKRAEAALRASEGKLRAALKAARLGAWEQDLETGTISATATYKANFGLPSDTPLTSELLCTLYHPDDRDRVVDAVRRSIADCTDCNDEFRVVWPDGSIHWLIARGSVVCDDTGRPVRTIGVTLDVTDRKNAEQAMQLLMDELSHRVKNTLATVGAIADQMLRDEVGPEFGQVFRGRIRALANTHALLSETNWAGANLQALVRAELAPFEAGQVRFAGPSVLLPPRMAQTLGLVFHELATNAAKYGALSTADGCVRVSWEVRTIRSGRILSILWTESGGPMVEPPTRSGFGSMLIRRSIEHELDGVVELAFAAQGLRCAIDVPISAVSRTEGPS